MASLKNPLGYIAAVVIGIGAIIVGFVSSRIWIIAFGLWALISAALAWFTGASAEVTGGDPSNRRLETTFRNVPSWVLIVIGLGFIVVVILFFIGRGG